MQHLNLSEPEDPDKAGFDEDREINKLSEELRITPLTDFADIHAFLETKDSIYGAQTYHERPNNGTISTRIYAYSIGAIFEMVPNQK